jgi:hypothetical protein
LYFLVSELNFDNIEDLSKNKGFSGDIATRISLYLEF